MVLSFLLTTIFILPYLKCLQSLENSTLSEAGAGNSPAVKDTFFRDFENYVASIPITQFEGDAVLHQFVDYINSAVTFRHIDLMRQPFPIYDITLVPNVTDTKEVLILQSGEDLLRTSGADNKRVYVVLRKSITSDSSGKSLFYAGYVYLKDGDAKVSEVENFGGREFIVEWDFWDHRGSRENRAFQFGWINCEDSIFVACQSKDTSAIPSFPVDTPKKDWSSTTPPAEIRMTLPVSVGFEFVCDMEITEYMAWYIVQKVEELVHSMPSKMMEPPSKKAIGRSMFRKSKAKGRSMENPNKENVDSDSDTVNANPVVLVGGDMVDTAGEVIQGVLTMGMGLIKSFGGLFGGLGTPNANFDEVIDQTLLGSAGEAVEEPWITNETVSEIEKEMQQPYSGGLGGMINPDENSAEIEMSSAEFEKTVSKGRSFGFGPFKKYVDPMPEDVVETIVNNSLTVFIDTFMHPGWKTLGESPITPGVTLKYETDPFIGYGPCPYIPVVKDSIKLAKTIDELISVHMQALRTQCITTTKKRYSSLSNDEYITKGPHNVIIVGNATLAITFGKFPISELSKMSQAFEMSVFSSVLYEQLVIPSAPLTPDGLLISRSAHTLGKAILLGLSKIPMEKFSIAHSVRLKRNMLKTLKSFFIKLLQDTVILETCIECAIDKLVNKNDREYVMGLRHFLLKGQDKVETIPTGNMTAIESTLGDFLMKNRRSILEKLEWFNVRPERGIQSMLLEQLDAMLETTTLTPNISVEKIILTDIPT